MALGDGTTWDETEPTLNSLVLDIAAYDQDLRVGVRSRMQVEHVWPIVQSNIGQAGYHNFITLQAQSAPPALNLNIISGTTQQVGAIYCDTNYNLVFEASNGSTIPIIEIGTSTSPGVKIIGSYATFGIGVVLQATSDIYISFCMGSGPSGNASIYVGSGNPPNTAPSFATMMTLPTGAQNAIEAFVPANFYYIVATTATAPISTPFSLQLGR